MRMKILLPMLILAIAVQACGQTGPLYYPDPKAPTYAPNKQAKNP